MYHDLMNLCSLPDSPFYYKDFGNYRTFSYRQATYSDFLLPFALECRGHTFHIPSSDLVSRPMQKFFNLHENPFTQNLDLSDDNIISVTEKLDGSLISSVRKGFNFQVKSKTSFESEQVILANKIIDENNDLRSGLYQATQDNYTVNMELIGPGNPNVLLYPKNELRILNVRNIQTGQYISPSEYFQEHRIVNSFPCKKSFLDSVPSMKGIEGFVVTLGSGEIFKIKTEEYILRHRTRDSINNDRDLYLACLNGYSDDLRYVFSYDPLAIQRIAFFEKKVRDDFNDVKNRYNRFMKRFFITGHNNDREYRKSFALAAKECEPDIMSILMNGFGKPDLDLNTGIKNFLEKRV